MRQGWAQLTARSAANLAAFERNEETGEAYDLALAFAQRMMDAKLHVNRLNIYQEDHEYRFNWPHIVHVQIWHDVVMPDPGRLDGQDPWSTRFVIYVLEPALMPHNNGPITLHVDTLEEAVIETAFYVNRYFYFKSDVAEIYGN